MGSNCGRDIFHRGFKPSRSMIVLFKDDGPLPQVSDLLLDRNIFKNINSHLLHYDRKD